MGCADGQAGELDARPPGEKRTATQKVRPAIRVAGRACLLSGRLCHLARHGQRRSNLFGGFVPIGGGWAGLTSRWGHPLGTAVPIVHTKWRARDHLLDDDVGFLAP